MPEIKYQYAFIDGDNIVSIDEITEDNRSQYKFRCIGCGKELLPRAINSIYRRAHFYHKELVECSGETYLHKLAKKIIKDKFDNSKEFLVEYCVNETCSQSECNYRTIRCTQNHLCQTVDLKQFYDTCTEEVPIDDYIADLLLTNSIEPNVPPILIEIWVSHKCDEEKRESGLKIIEIKIKDEQDIKDLGDKSKLCESEKIKFYSFKREKVKKHLTKIQRFLYNPNLGSNGCLTEVDCSMASYKVRSNSLVELNIINSDNYGKCDIWEPLIWMSLHKGLRRCNMCKFYYATQYESSAKCRLSTKYGKPEYPSMDEADRCSSFSVDKRRTACISSFSFEEVTLNPLSEKPEYKVIIAVGRYFDNYNLFKKKILYFLSEKVKTHLIVFIEFDSGFTSYLTEQLSKDLDFIIEPHSAEWGRYGSDAIKISNDEMTTEADALIAFWDGKSFGIGNLVNQAQKKGIKCAVINY